MQTRTGWQPPGSLPVLSRGWSQPPKPSCRTPLSSTRTRVPRGSSPRSKFSAAIEALQGIVKAHPDLGAVHYGIGQLMARMGRLDEAAAAFDRAEQAWPGSLPVSLALSDVLRRRGKLDRGQV